MNNTVCLISVVLVAIGCNKVKNDQPESYSRTETFSQTETYSNKENVKYLFRHLGDVDLKFTDSVFVGHMLSFAVFEDGKLSIGDNLDSRIKIFSTDGKSLRSISRKGDGPGETRKLRWHCVDSRGQVWISDYRLNRVSTYDTSGTFLGMWSPIEGCDECRYLWSGVIRVAIDRIYIGMIRGVPYPINLNSISSAVSAFDFQHNRIAEYGNFEKTVEKYTLDYPNYLFDVDSLGNLYFIPELSEDIWKFSPEGKIVKRFDYPVKEFKHVQELRPHRSGGKKVEQWATTYTNLGTMEVVGDYLLVSFVNKDAAFAQTFDLHYWHEYLQIFDLDGNCLVDHLKVPGKFLGSDHAGVLYFLQADEPDGMVISKYTFVPLKDSA